MLCVAAAVNNARGPLVAHARPIVVRINYPAGAANPTPVPASPARRRACATPPEVGRDKFKPLGGMGRMGKGDS